METFLGRKKHTLCISATKTFAEKDWQMSSFLKFLREILKGIVRESSAFFFRKNILEDKKATPRRHKQKGGSHK
ncbi:hypothetical protein NSA56_09035 [Oceanobacillus caeni]|uniref:Transposase n=1 Tax=Oceanobacillus caeni TaxID=405946 RepID=A0ABR5MFR8_9BACI|nr:hypothetical protein [Oceanobacillus caeni]KKE77845.1 hypothetical protein WH51_15485 [Bacilli bacterium VT-13-104]PZD85560.1 hypothetical protein DEJ64_09440 [Bacilli bacterium]KPH71221.1 hypothetical protein AFL42_15920 [Oceanobacillus caeni]MBU8790028.1 hypothetical protein [Oceanobacillus caeni]MCR1834542.1 hypothetical protein [Oceanobacillus caeni]